MNSKTCPEHQDMAISCSKIDEIHENVLLFRQELQAGMRKAFEMENQIIELRTSKEERWRVQSWWNKTLAASIGGIIVALLLEWTKFHGGK